MNLVNFSIKKCHNGITGVSGVIMGRESRGGFGGQVELGIICITMELTIILTEKMAKREEIDNKQEGSKDRTLGYTRGEGGRMGATFFELDKLSTST